MDTVYRDDVYLKFNNDTDKWELRLVNTDKIIGAARSIVQLVNEHNCLR